MIKNRSTASQLHEQLLHFRSCDCSCSTMDSVPVSEADDVSSILAGSTSLIGRLKTGNGMGTNHSHALTQNALCHRGDVVPNGLKVWIIQCTGFEIGMHFARRRFRAKRRIRSDRCAERRWSCSKLRGRCRHQRPCPHPRHGLGHEDRPLAALRERMIPTRSAGSSAPHYPALHKRRCHLAHPDRGRSPSSVRPKAADRRRGRAPATGVGRSLPSEYSVWRLLAKLSVKREARRNPPKPARPRSKSRGPVESGPKGRSFSC